MADPQSYLEKAKRLEQLERELWLKEGLPHLYGLGFYPWAWDFFSTTSRDSFLCAANQLGKSSTQIRKVIHLATCPSEWPKYFHDRRPQRFLYLYPTKELCADEYFTKWEPEFMPRGEFAKSKQYGYELETYTLRGKRFISGIRFSTGVYLAFGAYAQSGFNLQAGTIDYVAFDEEIDEPLFNELTQRRAAVDGMISGVFTPTVGHDLWFRCFERMGEEDEAFPNAFKRVISLYDSQTYVPTPYTKAGPSKWTTDRISRRIASCSSENEVKRRIYGRFVMESSDLLFPSYSEEKNYVRNPKPLWENPIYVAGLDWGAGGESHPSAISIVAINPEYTRARLVKFWRGDGVRTTAGDLLEKYLELKGNLPVVAAFYDYSCADLGTIAATQGIPLQKANKSREIGVPLVDTLLKYGALTIDHSEEAEKINKEFKLVKKTTAKQKAADDGVDSLRYALSKQPFQMNRIKELVDGLEPVSRNDTPVSKRIQRGSFQPELYEETFAEEIDEWNDLLEV